MYSPRPAEVITFRGSRLRSAVGAGLRQFLHQVMFRVAAGFVARHSNLALTAIGSTNGLGPVQSAASILTSTSAGRAKFLTASPSASAVDTLREPIAGNDPAT